MANQVVGYFGVGVGKTPLDGGEGWRGRDHRVMQNSRTTSLLQADAAIKAGLGVSQLGPILEDKIIANDPIVVTDITGSPT